MADLYPEIEPYDKGMLDVGDGNQIYWEVCGNAQGKPAVVFHGGPGSGCTPNHRRYFDPALYRIILFDQRGAGRSLPHASEFDTSLETNTTQNLIADIEKLRIHLGIEQWLVFAASWGTTLALAYAEQYPERVREMVLCAIATTTRLEVDWITRSAGRYFPEQWQRFRDGVPKTERDGNLAEAYARLLGSLDPAVREKAAQDWCDWEDTHVQIGSVHHHDPRYDDPKFRMAFARIVTHYFSHAAWLEEGIILRNASKLAGIPGLMVHGRLDLSSPLDIPWYIAKAWPGCELVIDNGVGHSLVTDTLVGATDKFASNSI